MTRARMSPHCPNRTMRIPTRMRPTKTPRPTNDSFQVPRVRAETKIRNGTLTSRTGKPNPHLTNYPSQVLRAIARTRIRSRTLTYRASPPNLRTQGPGSSRQPRMGPTKQPLPKGNTPIKMTCLI